MFALNYASPESGRVAREGVREAGGERGRKRRAEDSWITNHH